MNQQIASAAPGNNGESTPHDLFALTDEQILDIEPDAAAPVEQPFLAVPEQHAETVNTESARGPDSIATSPRAIESALQSAQAGVPVPQEPPPWLAAQMKDPWTGEAARELWNGAQQAKQEAAAYREAFATPEDARALKDLYPGGLNEARAASERARVLDDIDRAFFGTAGKSAQETSATREQLAQMMLREDPAAFREMVFAGLRVLEAATGDHGRDVAAVFRPRGLDEKESKNASTGANAVNTPPSEVRFVHPGDAGETGYNGTKPASAVGAQHVASHLGNTLASDPHLAAYASFEKAANEDLERSVGGAIERTIAQALPVSQPLLAVHNNSGTQARLPALQNRLGAAVRQDVETALKGDRQLGEQIAQILFGKRFDNETRAQVVRLIGERAQQLVPAAKRVLNDWTQATLAAHRGQSSHSDAAAARRELEPAAASPGAPSAKSASSAASARATAPRRVDYRKLSDEQILEL